VELPQLLVDDLGADESQVRAARRLADQHGRAFVEIAVEVGLAEEEALAELLARALDTHVVEVDRGELDEDSVRLVSPEVARRFLFVPLAPDPSGESIRVVFADPLDAAAVVAAREATGLGIQPLVATVSGVLAAIDRVYGCPSGDTRVLPRAELAPDITRRVASRDQTQPVHRLEDEASLGQRHEALLLSLIDAGVLTRAQYLQALRRLLGHE